MFLFILRQLLIVSDNYYITNSILVSSLLHTHTQSEVKYTKLSGALDVKNKQFYSSKERPELNPVLSALINEDIKKSIDAKRSAETTPEPFLTTTTALPILTTTTRKSTANDPESLDEAGSENKQVIIL